MPNSPPLYRQETTYSCAVACLRMVLASFGVDQDEATLRALCDCTELSGTDALRLVEAARHLGFPKSQKHNLNLAELGETLREGLYPIVYLQVRFTDDQPYQQHAAVVLQIEETATLNDPMRGVFQFSSSQFFEEWSRMRRLAVLIER